MPKKKALPKPALDPSFFAKKPISVWNRPLQLDSKGLFGALAKGAVHGFTGQWTEFGGDAVDGLAALGLVRRPLRSRGGEGLAVGGQARG